MESAISGHSIKDPHSDTLGSKDGQSSLDTQSYADSRESIPFQTGQTSNLKLLALLRIIAALGFAGFFYGFKIALTQLQTTFVHLALLGLLLLSGISLLRVLMGKNVSQKELFAYLFADGLILGMMLYFTGGAQNPLVSYLLIPVAIAAATLASARVWTLSVLMIAIYTLLLFFYQDVPSLNVAHGNHTSHSKESKKKHDTESVSELTTSTNQQHSSNTNQGKHEHHEHNHSNQQQAPHQQVSHQKGSPVRPISDLLLAEEPNKKNLVTFEFNLHILGMWFNFVLSAIFITFFVERMARGIRSQQQWVSEQRERTLRSEQLIAIASNAALTAHEIGTPLSNVKILLTDLVNQNSSSGSLISQRDLEDLELALTETQRCQNSLQNLSSSTQAGFTQDQNTKRGLQFLKLSEFKSRLKTQLQLLHPQWVPTINNQNSLDPIVNVHPLLDKALINLIDNAYRADPKLEITMSQEVKKKSGINTNILKVVITNRYDKNSYVSINELGAQPVDSQQGLGIGYFISNATIDWLGGSVSISQVDHKSIETVVKIPLIANENKAIAR